MIKILLIIWFIISFMQLCIEMYTDNQKIIKVTLIIWLIYNLILGTVVYFTNISGGKI